jgi:hypothetical protein
MDNVTTDERNRDRLIGAGLHIFYTQQQQCDARLNIVV